MSTIHLKTPNSRLEVSVRRDPVCWSSMTWWCWWESPDPAAFWYSDRINFSCLSFWILLSEKYTANSRNICPTITQDHRRNCRILKDDIEDQLFLSILFLSSTNELRWCVMTNDDRWWWCSLLPLSECKCTWHVDLDSDVIWILEAKVNEWMRSFECALIFFGWE